MACPVPVCAYLQHIAPCTVHTYLNSNRTAVLYSLASFLQCLLLFFSFIFSASHCTRWCTIIIIMSFRYRFNSNRISHQICVFFWLDLKYLSLSLVWLLFGLLLWFVLMDRGDWSTPLDCCNAHCIASRAQTHTRIGTGTGTGTAVVRFQHRRGYVFDWKTQLAISLI